MGLPLLVCGLLWLAGCESSLEKAQEALAAGHYARASQLLSQILAKEPGHQDARALLGRALFFSDQPQPALEALQQVQRTEAANPYLKQSLQAIEQALQAFDQAVSAQPPVLQTYIAQAPNAYLKDRAELALARQFEKNSQREAALETWDRLLKSSQDPLIHQLVLWEKARKQSPQYYQQLMEKYPSSPLRPAWFWAQIELARQQKDQETVNSLLVRFKEEARDSRLKAAILLKQGEYNQDYNPVATVNYFRTFLEQNPRHAQVRPVIYTIRSKMAQLLSQADHRFLAQVAMENLMYQTAANEYAALSQPTLQERYLTGWCALKARSDAQARTAFQNLVKHFPGTPQAGLAQVGLASLHRYAKRYPEALQQVQQVRQQAQDPAVLEAAWREEARVHDYMNKLDREAQAYRQLLDVRDSDPELPQDAETQTEAIWHVFWDHYTQREYKQALETLEKHIARIPGEQRAPFEYWRARAFEKTGDTRQAKVVYETLRGNSLTDYYTHRALVRLQGMDGPDRDFLVAPYQGYQIPPEATLPTLASNFRQKVEAPPATPEVPAELTTLLYLKRFEEYARLAETMDPDQVQVWRGLALHQLGNHYSAIRQYRASAEKKALYLPAAYPLAFFDTIEHQARQYGLNPFMVAGLIWQESQYQPTIRSWVGATGLMQIMPATGTQIAKELGLKDYRLTEAATNIRMGTWYLNFTSKSFAGNLVFAVASYNAGRGPVYKWERDFAGYDLDALIESIPYPETQDYVKRVFTGYGIYQSLYGKK